MCAELVLLSEIRPCTVDKGTPPFPFTITDQILKILFKPKLVSQYKLNLQMLEAQEKEHYSICKQFSKSKKPCSALFFCRVPSEMPLAGVGSVKSTHAHVAVCTQSTSLCKVNKWKSLLSQNRSSSARHCKDWNRLLLSLAPYSLYFTLTDYGCHKTIELGSLPR